MGTRSRARETRNPAPVLGAGRLIQPPS